MKKSKLRKVESSIFKTVNPTLVDVAKFIKDGSAKNIIIMCGAGISTAAGIPDFRSPETGLYANLEKYQLPYPEAIFDIDYFLRKPQAFYTLAKELYPGNFKPTLTHYFFRMLQEKNLLQSVFTQNIDTLETIAGLPSSYIIEAHGSFGSAECLKCKSDYSAESIKAQIELGQVIYCERLSCKGNKTALIKPKIVFFGEGLPTEFFDRLPDFHICDLLIVLGTSLSVHPFASLIDRVPTYTPRVLINLEAVGEATLFSRNSSAHSNSSHDSSTSSIRGDGKDSERAGFDFDGRTGRTNGLRDVHFLGSADEGVSKLAEELGWKIDLDQLMAEEWKTLDAIKLKASKKEGIKIEDSKESKKVETEVGATKDVRSGTEKIDELSSLVEKVDIAAGAESKTESIL